MGNHMSSVSPVASADKKDLIKIFHSETSALSELEGPVTAAEVMLDFPAQFLCCVSSAASTGRRICAVPADDKLRAPELYMLLPMEKLNTRFSMHNMAFLAVLASQDFRRKKGAISRSKVAPLPASMSCADQSFDAEGFGGRISIGSQSSKQSRVNVGTNVQEALPPYVKGGVCRSKSWMPKLETISEVHAS